MQVIGTNHVSMFQNSCPQSVQAHFSPTLGIRALSPGMRLMDDLKGFGICGFDLLGGGYSSGSRFRLGFFSVSAGGRGTSVVFDEDFLRLRELHGV